MKRILIGLLAVVVSLTAFTATGSDRLARAQTPTPGGVTSDNLEYVALVPFDQATSTGATVRGKWMYLTSWKNISIYDISDPEAPVQTANLPVGFMFENEEVAVSADQSFLLFSESLPGNALRVYDVEDKTNIVEIATIQGSGDHTTSCILKCTYAYGSDGAITDLRNPAKPKVIAQQGSPGNWHEKIGLLGGAHDVREYKDGFVIVSPLDATPIVINVRDPLNPKVVARGDGPEGWTGERGYLWHSGTWPNGGNDRWMLMQGEDVIAPGDSTTCEEKQGSFSTFDTKNYASTKKVTMTDTFELSGGTYADGQPAAYGFGCSAHWFEEHSTFDDGGLVAVSWYEAGTRLVKVADTGKIKEVGYFMPYAGATASAQWANDEIIYAVDYQRGIDILRYTGPEATAGGGSGPGGGGEDLQGPRVRLGTNDNTPKTGERIRFRTSLRRCNGHSGTNIALYRKLPGADRFAKIGSKKLNNACGAVFRHRVSWKGKATFRSVWPKQDEDHRRGRSRPLDVTAR